MTTDLPDTLAAPALRALEAAGITSITDLAKWREADLLDLHGVSPRAVAPLRAALARTGQHFRRQRPTDAGPQAVDAYLLGVPSPQRETLTDLRGVLRGILPAADEGLAYGMPSLRLHGAAVAGYAAARNHCTYAPMSGTVLATLATSITGYSVSKGALQFPPDRRLPSALLRRLIVARVMEISAVSAGWRREYHRDGRVKAEGAMRDGQLHGPWWWYRADGSLLRTGAFSDGVKTGEWTTWTPDLEHA